MASEVVTRFAPSPTGFLHIGGARTALFNWAYARKFGGRMLLRIEDTDRTRSNDEAITAILDGLAWLGIEWDDDPVYQHARAGRHGEAVEELLQAGKAYRCYCSAEELAAMREKARAEGRPMRYDGTWRDREHSDAPENIAPVIRFKAPQQGEIVIADKVQGDVTFANDQLDDLILLRSDGSPTYMLSVVVDDHDMGVTHIIRGDDHLTNAARQAQIYLALNWDLPVFAHIPLIHGADGAKLSKRHGAIGIDAYRHMGYLPAAIRNYLARLGWSHGDEEIFSSAQFIEWFDFDAIGRSPARFDFAKLENLNGHYIREGDDAMLADAVIDLLPRLDISNTWAEKVDAALRAKLLAAMPGLKARAKTIVELVEGAGFLFRARPLPMDDGARKLLEPPARAMLARLLPALEALADWTSLNIEQAIRDFAEQNELKLGKVAQPLRAALTGTVVSPGIFDVLEVLGREESLGRIADQANETG